MSHLRYVEANSQFKHLIKSVCFTSPLCLHSTEVMNRAENAIELELVCFFFLKKVLTKSYRNGCWAGSTDLTVKWFIAMEKVTNHRELKDLNKTGDSSLSTAEEQNMLNKLATRDRMVYFHDEVLGNVMYLHFMNFSDDIFCKSLCMDGLFWVNIAWMMKWNMHRNMPNFWAEGSAVEFFCSLFLMCLEEKLAW